MDDAVITCSLILLFCLVLPMWTFRRAIFDFTVPPQPDMPLVRGRRKVHLVDLYGHGSRAGKLVRTLVDEFTVAIDV
eukprot:scaffold4242_cov175-Amphora_coffeaeformis.AAC.1